MKSFFTSFLATCTLILSFSACTSVDEYELTRSVAPVVTNGTWKVNSFVASNNNQTSEFAGYQFSFSGAGTFAAEKNGVSVPGQWSEDNISKKVTLTINTTDQVLSKLNNTWDVIDISNSEVRFDATSVLGQIHLNITNQ